MKMLAGLLYLLKTLMVKLPAQPFFMSTWTKLMPNQWLANQLSAQSKQSHSEFVVLKSLHI